MNNGYTCRHVFQIKCKITSTREKTLKEIINHDNDCSMFSFTILSHEHNDEINILIHESNSNAEMLPSSYHHSVWKLYSS